MKTKESMKVLMKSLKVEIVDVAEQQLYQEIREVSNPTVLFPESA